MTATTATAAVRAICAAATIENLEPDRERTNRGTNENPRQEHLAVQTLQETR